MDGEAAEKAGILVHHGVVSTNVGEHCGSYLGGCRNLKIRMHVARFKHRSHAVREESYG